MSCAVYHSALLRFDSAVLFSTSTHVLSDCTDKTCVITSSLVNRQSCYPRAAALHDTAAVGGRKQHRLWRRRRRLHIEVCMNIDRERRKEQLNDRADDKTKITLLIVRLFIQKNSFIINYLHPWKLTAPQWDFSLQEHLGKHNKTSHVQLLIRQNDMKKKKLERDEICLLVRHGVQQHWQLLHTHTSSLNKPKQEQTQPFKGFIRLYSNKKH